jgi:hypothetical protein
MMAKARGAVERVDGTHPSHDLAAYAGEYEHPAYGPIAVAVDGSALQLTFHGTQDALTHRHYDTFDWDTGFFGMVFPFTFATDARGGIASVSIPFQTGVEDIRFSRIAAKELRDPSFLAQFAGTYELMSMTVTIALKGEDALVATLPGQPEIVLEPYAGREFTVRGQSGMSLRFEQDESGAVTGFVFTQPGATTLATRVES